MNKNKKKYQNNIQKDKIKIIFYFYITKYIQT